jgi:hypothetical protein
MSDKWSEALGSINAYVEKLPDDSKVTVATFDSVAGLQFEVVRDDVVQTKWKNISDKDAEPRGNTPLFDAVGKIVTMANEADNDKTVIIIMTDGQENCSQELGKRDATEMIERCKAKGWEVIFLGADFNAYGEAQNIGVHVNQVLNIGRGQFAASMMNLAAKSTMYASAGQAMSFSDQDRTEAMKKMPDVQ